MAKCVISLHLKLRSLCIRCNRMNHCIKYRIVISNNTPKSVERPLEVSNKSSVKYFIFEDIH